MNPSTETRKDFEMMTLPQLEALYRTALRVLNNEREARTVVEESFVQAYHAWLKGNRQTNCRVWLFRIMANALTNRCQQTLGRTDLRNNLEEIDTTLSHSRLIVQQLIGDLEQVPLSAISDEAVERAIQELPDCCRLIVVLHLQEHFSYREIADITGIQLEAVRSRLHQGRRLIRESLSIAWPVMATAM